jgi:hypothetical protein
MLSDWDDLKGQLEWEFLVARNLSLNLVEKRLGQALNGDWSQLLHDMFACRGDEFAQWSKEDWTCHNCWTSFFRDTLWRWRLVRKRGTHETPRLARAFTLVFLKPGKSGSFKRKIVGEPSLPNAYHTFPTNRIEILDTGTIARSSATKRVWRMPNSSMCEGL